MVNRHRNLKPRLLRNLKEYLELSETLKELDVRLYLLRFDRLHEKETAAEQALLKVSDAVKEAEMALEAATGMRTRGEEELEGIQQALSQAHDALLRQNDALHAARESLSEIRNRIQNGGENIERLEGEIESLHARLRLIEATMTQSDGGLSEAEMLHRLNAELTDELRALAIYPAERKFGEIAFAEYDYTIVTTGADAAMADEINRVLSTRPLTVTRRTKSGEKEVDILDFIHRCGAKFENGAIKLNAVLSAGEGNYLNPELLITALKKAVGILSGSVTEERYRILRRRVLLADGETEFR